MESDPATGRRRAIPRGRLDRRRRTLVARRGAVNRLYLGMSPWLPARTLALALALAACGPTAAQVRAARVAHYDASRHTILEAVHGALSDSRYRVWSAADGVVWSTRRSFLRDGTALASPRFRTHGGDVDVYSVAMRIEILGEAGDRSIRVMPTITLFRPTLRPLELAPSDRSVPPWVHGQVDALYVRIHERLRASAIRPAGP